MSRTVTPGNYSGKEKQQFYWGAKILFVFSFGGDIQHGSLLLGMLWTTLTHLINVACVYSACQVLVFQNKDVFISWTNAGWKMIARLKHVYKCNCKSMWLSTRPELKIIAFSIDKPKDSRPNSMNFCVMVWNINLGTNYNAVHIVKSTITAVFMLFTWS